MCRSKKKSLVGGGAGVGAEPMPFAHDCVGAVPKADGCGMSMLTTDGRRITSVATDVTGEHLDALHDRYRDNPCAEAWRHAAVVRAASSTPTRWPLWMTRRGTRRLRPSGRGAYP
jgi:hypothetical protein